MKSRGRQKHEFDLEPPRKKPLADAEPRAKWINKVSAAFIQPSSRNKEYYRVILETLWPQGHGVPGPHVTEIEVRSAINEYRRTKHNEGPYHDVFRRVRELQGEEGVVGIAKRGKSYQLVNLTLRPKRKPREKLSDEEWEKILEAYDRRCAVCGRREPEVRLQQDHKIPRDRQGGNETSNWQPLCDECNNFKSTACRGCVLECLTCPWAFPEKFAPLKISPENSERIRKRALSLEKRADVLLNDLITEFLGGDED